MPAYRKIRRARPEDQIQKAVFQHLRVRGAPRMVYWHTPNGGARRPIEAAILKGLGVRPGVSDICIVREGKFYALELKATDGRPTEAQLKWKDEVNDAGGFAAICYGLNAVLACLEMWGHLRGKTNLPKTEMLL